MDSEGDVLARKTIQIVDVSFADTVTVAAAVRDNAIITAIILLICLVIIPTHWFFNRFLPPKKEAAVDR